MKEEYRVAEMFNKSCKEHSNIEFVHRETSSRGKYMDIEYIFHKTKKRKEYVRLELKLFPDTRRNSQNFLTALGAILKGRNLPTAARTALPVVYGLLILEKHEHIVKKLAHNISRDDWKNLQTVFGCTYVVIFNNKTKTISHYDWNKFRD